MSIKKPEEFLRNAVVDIAEQMIIAAKTAPKGRGLERLYYLLITGNEINIISHKLTEMSAEHNVPFLARDAGNLLKTDALVLIGASYSPRNVQLCNHCGFGCDTKPNDVPCAISTVDLGIAIGSAVSVAAFHHVDNRIMYSVGRAVVELGLFPKEVKAVYGIPLSVSEKNIFFDRS